MRRPRLVTQLSVPLGFVLVAAVTGLAAYTVHSIRAFYFEQTVRSMRSQTTLLARALPLHGIPDRTALDKTIKDLIAETGIRVTLVRRDGVVVADSARPADQLDNHANRPEIREALQGRVGTSSRFSTTLGEPLLYVAVPHRPATEQGVAVIRTSIPMTAVHAAIRGTLVRAAGFAAFLACLGIAAVWVTSRRVSRPIEALAAVADEYAGGRFDARVPLGGSREVVNLARAVRRMVNEVRSRIAALTQQRNEQRAVLASMSEGVLAVSNDGRVMMINETAANWLGVEVRDIHSGVGSILTHDRALRECIEHMLNEQQMQECSCTVTHPTMRHLQLHGAPIVDDHGQRIGAVIVMNDVTRIQRLESMRRDFVANVSHELKTPITSIKGFLETVTSGSVDDPAETRRFLEIALRQADRLNAIIEDLLSLSRIEEEADAGALVRENAPVRAILLEAAEVCRRKAHEKSISVRISCPQELVVEVNAPLMEQAIVNLLDNAVKYSEPGGVVDIVATVVDGELSVAVRDRGRGIEPEHLPRLFERFYRVDKARSRSLGGTGLGLAIVKHIANAHGGWVDVTSVLGEGTTFTIRIPIPSSVPHLPSNAGTAGPPETSQT